MDFDLDEQLELLQRQLMAVQQQKTNPLSERTVAEIMVKLYHSGFAFIPTTDGNQYITPSKLDEEVAQLVKERGKISLSILPQLLNVGPDILEARLNSISQNHPVTRHGGNLFSQKYFEGIITGVAQRLEEEGRVELESVAIEHQMKLQFAEKIIMSSLHRLNAVKTGNQLITREYTLLKKAKVLGFLASLNNPLQLQVLYRTIGGQSKGIQELVNELLQEGRIKGKIQNGYYVPDRFTSGQKRKVCQFLDNNGYIDLEMMQKKLLVARPQEWISKNLGDNFVKVERVYFKQAKLQSLASQANELLRSEGFIELAHVLPIQFGEKALRDFLEERCGLKEYFLCQGYCYSNDWLERLASQFKHKIIQSIFFKKPQPKGKDSKKKGKKEKIELVTQEQLQEVLFSGGFTDYSGAESLAPEVLPLLLQRLDQLRKKIEKELAQSKGLITSAFLKYKSCKTIFRTEESLSRAINIIQKQIKKGEKWIDPDFGPNESDPTGQYSVLYYDNILPKGWPSVETIKWEEIKPAQLLQIQKESGNKPYPMKKCPLVALLNLVELHNRKGFKLHNPEVQPLVQQSQLPLTYQFYINEKEKRTVLVDSLLPFIQGKQLGSLGRYSYVQKAYAKLRYCYKGIMGVGIQQMLMQITGRNSIRYCGDIEKQRELLFEKLIVHVKRGDFVVVMAEGEADKRLVIEDQQSQLYALHPYSISGTPQAVKLQSTSVSIPLKLTIQLFRNIYVIEVPNQ